MQGDNRFPKRKKILQTNFPYGNECLNQALSIGKFDKEVSLFSVRKSLRTDQQILIPNLNLFCELSKKTRRMKVKLTIKHGDGLIDNKPIDEWSNHQPLYNRCLMFFNCLFKESISARISRGTIRNEWLFANRIGRLKNFKWKFSLTAHKSFPRTTFLEL